MGDHRLKIFVKAPKQKRDQSIVSKKIFFLYTLNQHYNILQEECLLFVKRKGSYMQLTARILDIQAGERNIVILDDDTAGLIGIHSSDRVRIHRSNG